MFRTIHVTQNPTKSQPQIPHASDTAERIPHLGREAFSSTWGFVGNDLHLLMVTLPETNIKFTP